MGWNRTNNGMIRILSGWTGPGGSTTAFINLVNKMNDAGHKSVLHGIIYYPQGRCAFEPITEELDYKRRDKVIVHYPPNIASRHPFIKPDCKVSVFSCHETTVIDLNNINLEVFDWVQFVSPLQQEYHNISHPNQIVIPNFMTKLLPNFKTCDEPTAGIIGSVDRNKGTHISIQRALDDGFKKILLFGLPTDKEYWEDVVKPMVDGKIVNFVGVCEDQQQMYDMITDCYLSSERECLPFVVGECEMTDTKFHGIFGRAYLNQKFIYSDEEIMTKWKYILKLENS